MYLICKFAFQILFSSVYTIISQQNVESRSNHILSVMAQSNLIADISCFLHCRSFIVILRIIVIHFTLTRASLAVMAITQ